ncbi:MULTISPECIES: nuclease domain-containing protein [Liquorilactobacillus]|uniref:nuclease domain-containing protein n=1 Tax=Liquorilactobacillus TaxID=2767888 RepID=UPI0021C3F9A3|nr:nuclease domain-containing protein [Liquorilactobacillus satsumensis]MCP9328867.1 hypothetical protein [Liquorilactobacillus satsumensis]
MGLQCNLEVGTNGHKKKCQLKLYSEDCLFELEDNQIEIIPEYKSFNIMIKADNSNIGYFELPELEDYEIQNREEYLESDKRETYKFNKSYCIYASNRKDKESLINLQTVPLTPGYYTIHITLSSGKQFFAYWYISPKELTTPEWQIMRDDVETMVKGLATDYSRQMPSKIKSIVGADSRSILDDDSAFLVDQETRIRYAIETLRNEAKYKISKTYTWVPAGTKNEIDQQTVRKIGERPDKKGMLYTPKRYLEYNVAANQWLKLFLMRLVKFCGNQIVYNQRVKIATKNEYNVQHRYAKCWTESERQYFEKTFTSNIEELQGATVILKKMQEYLRLVLEDAFLKKASMPSNTALPKALMLNASYNLLYKVYVVLFQKKEHFTLAKSYRQYWKKTAQLYEIWTFIRVITSLIRQGFEPISGWIYDTRGKERVLPFLTEGTQISFSTNKLNINLTYNETIPANRHDISLKRPLITVSGRNKPDIRIDIFDLKKRYLGSILLDAKYIKLSDILNKIRPSERKERLREQFTSYVNDTSSPFHDSYQYLQDMRPVRALLVLYPTGNEGFQENRQEESMYTGRNVRYIQVRPSGDETELDKTILANIREIQSRSKIFEAFDLYNSKE